MMFRLLALAALAAAAGPAWASDTFEGCVSAEGFEVFDGQVHLLVGTEAEETKGVDYTVLKSTVLRESEAYCVDAEDGTTRYPLFYRSTAQTIQFLIEGETSRADILCVEISAGVPAARSCSDETTVVSESGAHID